MRAPSRQERWAIRIARFGSRNLGVRFLVALVLSALVWAAVTLEGNPNTEELFPDDLIVEPVNRPANLVLAAEIEPVRVNVRGPTSDVARLTLRDFVARVDLATAKAGVQQVPVAVTVSYHAVEVVLVTPETVTVSLDPLETRTVPIVAQVKSAPAAGFRAEIDQLSAEPAEVSVSGGASAVVQVAAVQAELSLEGSTRTVTQQTLLRPIDSQGTEVAGVLVQPQIVQVTVPVTRITSRKRVPVLAEVTGELAPGFVISRLGVVPSTVEIEGQQEDLERVETVTTETVDVSGARGDVRREVGFLRPPGITVLSERQLVNVTVGVQPLEDTTSLQAAVVFSNLSAGLRATADEPFVQIVVAGPAEVLTGLQGGDVVAEVDLRNRAAGLHDIQPLINVPPGLRVELVTPTVIAVRITAAADDPVGAITPLPGAGGLVPTPTPNTRSGV